jgi:transcriptional regulator with XRE-family HTH domain
MHLGDKLKLYRKEKGLDQFQMADKVGVSHRKYQEIEKTGIIQKVGDLAVVNKLLNENTQSVAHENPPTDELNQVLPMGDVRITVGDYIKKIEENARKVEE